MAAKNKVEITVKVRDLETDVVTDERLVFYPPSTGFAVDLASNPVKTVFELWSLLLARWDRKRRYTPEFLQYSVESESLGEINRAVGEVLGLPKYVEGEGPNVQPLQETPNPGA